jgi:hypothetical protein
MKGKRMGVAKVGIDARSIVDWIEPNETLPTLTFGFVILDVYAPVPGGQCSLADTVTLATSNDTLTSYSWSALPVIRATQARIKKIMQVDDDVGKVASSSPVIICKCLVRLWSSAISAARMCSPRFGRLGDRQHARFQHAKLADRGVFLLFLLLSRSSFSTPPTQPKLLNSFWKIYWSKAPRSQRLPGARN